MKYHVWHHNDLDGRASAAIIDYYLSINDKSYEINFYEINYGEPFDDSKVDYENDTVYMVDFSLQPYEKMKEVLDKDIIWIDHHKTCVEYVKEYGMDNRGWIADDQGAACLMTWKYLFEDQEAPRGLKMLSQYDIWDKDGEYDWNDCKALQLGAYSMDTSPDNTVFWHVVLTEDSDAALDNIIGKGHLLLSNNNKRQASLAKTYAYEMSFYGYKAIVMNTAESGSSVFENAFDVSKYEIMVSYRFTKGKYWTVSLYSTNPDINCGAICKEIGGQGPFKSGGGHPGAAGFQTDTKHLMSLLGEQL